MSRLSLPCHGVGGQKGPPGALSYVGLCFPNVCGTCKKVTSETIDPYIQVTSSDPTRFVKKETLIKV